MLRALLYLRLTSLKNVLLSRLRRLRQPKYLAGAIVGAGYFYFIFFNGWNHGERGVPSSGMLTPNQLVPADSTALMLAIGALALLVVTVFMWMVPSQTPGLSFSTAESAFLFPAPISRRALIHFKLLSNQLSVLLQSLFFSLIFNGRGLSSGRALQIVLGWWLILTLVNLHYMGCSLTITRLVQHGVGALRRRLYFLAGIIIVVGGTFIWIGQALRPPTETDLADIPSSMRWLLTLLDAGPLHALLLPFKWILGPFFAVGLKEFGLALLPAVSLLLLHYLWVVKMEVAFEEASLAHAEKRAIRRAGIQSGDYRSRETPGKARRAPFVLREKGRPEIAFLWKNLLSTRAFFNLRVWVICATTIVIGSRLFGSMGLWQQNLLSGVSVGVVVLGLYVIVFGPLLARFDLRSDLVNADILKTYPVRGWQLVLGELLAPTAILTGVIWLTLLTGLAAFQPTQTLPGWLDSELRVTYALCFAALTPVLVALQLIVPNAAAVVFPAWFQTSRTVGGGIEMMGQRLIFVFGQIFIIVLALLPAVAIAGVLIFVTQWIIGPLLAVIFASIIVILVLSTEVGLALWWLGRRFEHFDLSSEQRP